MWDASRPLMPLKSRASSRGWINNFGGYAINCHLGIGELAPERFQPISQTMSVLGFARHERDAGDDAMGLGDVQGPCEIEPCMCLHKVLDHTVGECLRIVVVDQVHGAEVFGSLAVAVHHEAVV